MIDREQCRITVAVMTHNETQEFHWLMRALEPGRALIDEIVVVDDFSDPECVAAIRSYEKTWPLRFHQRALRQNFAAQRNYVKSLCRGRLIFFPDADELPPAHLLLRLPDLLGFMEAQDIDACTLPRLNVWMDRPILPDPMTLDLSEPDINQSWEDQFRVLRNVPNLRWTLRLNEYLIGIRRAYRFPHSRDYALFHCKTVARQKRQRIFYRSLWTRHFSRTWNSIAKRIGLRPKPGWIEADPPI